MTTVLLLAVAHDVFIVIYCRMDCHEPLYVFVGYRSTAIVTLFFLAVLCRSVFTPLVIIAPSGGGYFSAFEPFVFLGPFFVNFV